MCTLYGIINHYISTRKYNGNIIGLTEAEAQPGNKCSDLMPVRALSECDTVSYPYGKGKVSAVNVILL